MYNLKEYLAALMQIWWPLMSCAAFTILSVIAALKTNSNKFFLTGAIILAVAFFFVASFFAWDDQRKMVATAETKARDLRTELDRERDRSIPKLSLNIDMAIINSAKEKPHVYVILFAALSNSPTGAPSIAESWSLEVTDPSSNKKLNAPIVVVAKSISIPSGDGKTITVPGEALYEKSMTPLKGGEKIRGILMFELAEIKQKQLPKKLHLQLKCKDVVGAEVSTNMNWSADTGEKFKYFPGLTMPQIK